MGQDGLGYLFADAHHRVQGGHRLLKDHGDLGAPKLTQRIGREIKKAGRFSVSVLEVDFAAHSRGAWKQTHDGQ
jgi:hypothetical protein